jgi:hypothetical protein
MDSKVRALAALASKRVLEEAGRRGMREDCGCVLVSFRCSNCSEAGECGVVRGSGGTHVEHGDVGVVCHFCLLWFSFLVD